MTANCGKMSLLLPIIAMLVQNAFPTPTPAGELAAIDPFDNNIPADLKLKEWNPEDPAEFDKLVTLALIGLNKIREANGVTAKLTAEDDMMFWSGLVSDHINGLFSQKGDSFTIPIKDDPSVQFFGKIIETKKDEQNKTMSTSDILIESISNWYKKTQAEVKNGVKKETISIFNPNTISIGLGVSKKTVNKDTFYTCVVNFATKEQFDHFHKMAEEMEKVDKP